MGKIALFGAGELGASLLKRLSAEDVLVSYFIDNKKTGEHCGIPIVTLEHAKNECEGCYIATLEYYDEIEEQLKNSHLKILGNRKSLKKLFSSHYCISNDVKIEFDIGAAISQICHLAIDLIDSCQLQCPGCYRGTQFIKNTGNQISFEKFEDVCRKLKRHNFTRVALYNWSEPFLNKELEEYVNVFRRIVGRDIYLSVSSNLSLKYIPNLKQVLMAGVNDLLISVSGFSQKIHKIYHKGSDIEVVKKHLEYIAPFANDMGTRVVIKYLDFGYNKREIPLFKEYASQLGLTFISMPGYGSPQDPNDRSILKYHEDKMKEDLYQKWSMKAFMEGISKVCNSQFYLDYNADVYLCCLFPNLERFRIGNFLENSLEELLARRQLSTFCTRCSVKMD